MTLERIENGFIIAPDFKYTKVDQASAKLAGVYGGWVYDHMLLIGGAGYWLTNENRAFQMAYGGAVVKWLVQSKEPVGFSLGALIGGGRATLPTTFAGFGPIDNDRDGNNMDSRPTYIVVSSGTFAVRRDFMVFEPEADVNLKLARQVRLAVGVGYRVVGGAFDMNRQLRGVSGSVSLQFFTAAGMRSPRRHRP